ncbi:hypothetical protein [Alteraurantiacibacter buctensis]|uniref:Tetratricopeptide repeat protein n=1 Tax=Alteraurantiacibacter buctensis TaxID=1503981 RepID=A0A844Z186_9SPHN|nr:hypothetical protein [Alteraurantiacibacter buctensis]MXO72464.1 hypothetical protein [Alteraurantiacibacter buctensis]
MHRNWGFSALAIVATLVTALPASAEQMRVDGYFPAGNDEAATLRSLAVENFSGEDGPRLSLQVADALRDVRIDGRPWLSVLVGRFGRDADGVLQGDVRTRVDENVTMLRRDVCVSYDQYDNCQARENREVECLRATTVVRPELRLVRRGGQLVWRYSQESSRGAEFCPGFDDEPDFDAQVDSMLADFTTQIRYALAPAHESRSIRVMGGRDELPRPLRDTYRQAMRQTERDPAAACAIFASLLPQAPGHVQLVHNNALCAEQAGDYAAAEQGYQQLTTSRGAQREGREGLARMAQYRRGRAQIEQRGL